MTMLGSASPNGTNAPYCKDVVLYCDWATVTYVVAAVASLALYFLLGDERNLIAEYRRLNWAPVALGVVIIGLEVGFIYAYKAGWEVSMASVVQSAFLAIALLFVGYLAYHEALTWQKVAGVGICLAGLAVINMG